MNVPVNAPLLSDDAKNNAISALNGGWISASGPFVAKFESDFARVFGVKHAITVANGTAALHVALLSLGIGAGDEVIVPAFTMAASWLAVMYTGAKPIFVDCALDTYNIDVNKIEEKITPRTKAIMPVHIYGQPCDLDAIMFLAKKYNVSVVEDAAEAHGALYHGKLAGTFGDLGCFSFYANKIITTGEGGMIITDRQDLADKCRKLKDLHHSEKRFIHDGAGFNYRLTNIQAAIGCGELMHLEEYVQKKIRMANMYNEILSDIKGVIMPSIIKQTRSVYWMYGILIDNNKVIITKDQLREELRKAGIDTRDFFYPPDAQPVLLDLLEGESFPNAKYLSEHGLYLPSGLAITDDEIKYVGEQLKKLVK